MSVKNIFPIVETYSEVLFKNSWKHENLNNDNTTELQENWNDNLNWIKPSVFMFRD